MRGSWVLLLLVLCLSSAVPAGASEQFRLWQALTPDAREDGWSAPGPGDARQDTVWFGGDAGNGIAFVGGVWDFETPGSNGFQGCTSSDETSNPGVYFGVVTAAVFQTHGDPCVPMILATAGQIWCGIHQDEADKRDFLAGMGYQNDMCQRAFSPLRAINPTTQSVDISFTYFAHSEGGFDYTYVNLLCYDNANELIDEQSIASISGIIGDHEDPVVFDQGIEVAQPRVAEDSLTPPIGARGGVQVGDVQNAEPTTYHSTSRPGQLALSCES